MRPTVKLVSALFLLAFAPALAAQEERHIIRSVAFSIEGSTSEQALRSFTGLREGLEFPTAAALADFLERTRRVLVDDRVFKTVEVLDEAGATENGAVQHAVTVRVVDSPTFVPLPDISYDSNLGLELGVQVHYDNAFGSMSNWFLDSYVVPGGKPGAYDIDGWDIHPRIAAVMVGGVAWTLDLELRREELQSWDGGTELASWNDDYVTVSANAKLPLVGLLYYEAQPGFASRFNTSDLMANGANPKDFLGPNYRQALGIGEVDWVGNFRSGYDLRLEDLLQTALGPGDIGLSDEVSATALWYLPFSFLDYYGRARVQANSGELPTDLGKNLRGIADDTMTGVASAFLQQTLGIDLGLPERILDVQLHPFFDVGTALPAARAWNAAQDIRAGTGLDLVFFADALPDIFIRATYGIELGAAQPFAVPEIVFDTTMSY